MWTKNPALLAVKRSRTPEYHWRSVAPLPYHNPRKKNQKENRIATSELQSVPRQKHFSPHVCSALFFLVFCLVCLHSTPHGRTEHASLLHDTAGRWMRGGPGAEGEAPRYVKWEPGRADKMEPKKSPKSRRRRTCVRAHRYRHAVCFFFFVMFFRPSPPLPLGTAWSGCAEMPLRSVSAELLQRERSFLPSSRVCGEALQPPSTSFSFSSSERAVKISYTYATATPSGILPH